jgi:hypothetical protein
MNKGIGNRWKNVKLNLPPNEKKETATDTVPVKRNYSLNNVVTLTKEKGEFL